MTTEDNYIPVYERRKLDGSLLVPDEDPCWVSREGVGEIEYTCTPKQ